MPDAPIQLQYVTPPRFSPLAAKPQTHWALRWLRHFAVFLGWAVAATASLPGLFVMVVVAQSLKRIRQRRAHMVLVYLEQAVRLNLPLPAMLDAAALSEHGVLRKRLQHLAEVLEGGAMLDAALPHAVPELPRRTLDLIGAAQNLGRLPQVLAQLTAEGRHTTDTEPTDDAVARIYPIFFLVVMPLVVGFLLVFIVPKFEEIYKDFNTPLPAVSRFVIGLARHAVNDTTFSLLAGAIFVGLYVAAGIMVASLFTAKPSTSPLWWRRLLWHVPVLGRIQLNRSIADICSTLALAIEAGWSLPRAIDEAAALSINPVLRNRLHRWRHSIEAGGDIASAARAARLPAIFCQLVGSPSGRHLASSLEFLSQYYRSRFSRLAYVLRAVRVPALTILFGGIVVLIALALLIPVWNLADHIGRHTWELKR